MNTNIECPRCESPLNEERKSLKMWDGKRYCIECINSVSPELFEYRLKHKYLIDTIPLEGTSRVRIFKMNYFYPAIASWIIFLILGFLIGELRITSIFALGVTVFLFVIMLLDLIFDFSPATLYFPRSMIVHNNKLIVIHEDEKKIFDFSNFYYYEGNIKETIESMYLPNQPAIILENKMTWDKLRLRWDQICYPCGLTSEMREIWIRFFQLINKDSQEVLSSNEFSIRLLVLVLGVAALLLAIICWNQAVGFSFFLVAALERTICLLNIAKRGSSKIFAICATFATSFIYFYAFVTRNIVLACAISFSLSFLVFAISQYIKSNNE